MALSASLMPMVGLNKDLSSSDIPDGAATDATNIRFREGAAEIFLGQTDAYAQATGPASPIPPVSAYPVRIPSGLYWLVLGLNKAYCVTGTPAVWTNVTRQTAAVDVNYAATLNLRWNGGVLNGVPIVNNGVDVPQMWSPAGPTAKLQALTAWPASTTARVLRPHGVTMIALDVTTDGTRHPHRVLFSDPADPGTVPVSWNVADATKLAGDRDLEGAGYLVDGLTMRESFIIYKENSTHRMSFVGGTALYGFTTVFSSSGMLAPNCAVEVDGSHVVLTNNDVVIHDGTTIKSVVDKSMRRWLFQNIDQENYDKCFLVKNVYFNEVWICFPQLGQTSCSMALVFNYKDNTIGLRELPGVVSGMTGQVDDSASQSWASDTQAWEEDTSAWAENEFGAQQERTTLCAPTRQSLVLADSGSQFFDTNVRGFLERTGLPMAAPNAVKTLTRLRLRVKGYQGAVLTVTVGAQMVRDGPITWSAPRPFRIGIDTSVDALVTGRFLAYRIRSDIRASWRLEGMEMEFVQRGRF